MLKKVEIYEPAT